MAGAGRGKYAGNIGFIYREVAVMTTVLIIVCIVFCVGVILAISGHLGFGIARDKAWRRNIRRHHARRAHHNP
jgi:hypothetical protein